MKRESDLQKGQDNRLKVVSQLSKNSLYLTPLHPYFKHHPISEKADKNTPIGRLKDFKTDESMGLDMEIECNGYSEKKILIIRWFSDWDIYIKNTSEGDILSSYKNSLLLILNDPLKDKFGLIRYYNLMPFSFIQKQRWSWVKRKSKGNEKRYALMDFTGRPISPNKLIGYPINGAPGIFGSVPDIWTALKNTWI